MKLTLLGTGTPTPSLKRTSSSYLLEVESDVILFDSGPGAFLRLLQAGKKPTDVTHIVFSHLHYDHCADFASIALTRWDHFKGDFQKPLKVYGPKGVEEFVGTLFSKDVGAFRPDIDSRIKHPTSIGYYKARGGKGRRPDLETCVKVLHGGDCLNENGWQLQCAEVIHFQPHLACLGYRVDANGQSFCYSGDSSPSKDLVELAKKCDVLLHMCHRISGTELVASAKTSSSGHLEVARLAQEAKVKSCIFTHISDQMDVPGVPERLIREIAALYEGNSIWSQDLMEIDFLEPVPKALI